MAEVTVILGPQGSGKSREVEKIVDDRPAMHVGSMSAFGLKNDPFYISKLLIKAAGLGKRIVVIEEAVEGIREILLALALTGIPVEVVICSDCIKPSEVESFEPYIKIIDLGETGKKQNEGIASHPEYREFKKLLNNNS